MADGGEAARPSTARRSAAAAVAARRLRRELEGIGWAALMVVAAVVAAEVVKPQAPGAQLSPVFVIPVAAAAAFLRPAATVFAALTAAAAYDFFFTTPLYTFDVDNAADLVTLAVLLTVAALVGAVAARARRAERGAREAARRSDALHDLAAAALHGADDPALLGAAAAALRRLSHRAAVFASVETGSVRIAAQSEAVQLSSDDLEAARWTAREGGRSRAGAYPFFGSSFDFWPTGRDGLVAGVRLWDPDGRAQLSEHDLDLVLGYVALAGRRAPRRGGAA